VTLIDNAAEKYGEFWKTFGAEHVRKNKRAMIAELLIDIDPAFIDQIHPDEMRALRLYADGARDTDKTAYSQRMRAVSKLRSLTMGQSSAIEIALRRRHTKKISGDRLKAMQRVCLSEYVKNPDDVHARNAAMVAYSPLMGMIAKKHHSKPFAAARFEYDDIFILAMLELPETLKKFKSENGTEFTTYAVGRISPLVWKNMQKELAIFKANCASEHARTKAKLDDTERESKIAELYAFTNTLSIDQAVQSHRSGSQGDDGIPLLALVARKGVSVEEELEQKLVLEKITHVMNGLTETEREVVTAYCCEDKKVAEIARLFNRSKPWVYSIYKAAVQKIRNAIAE